MVLASLEKFSYINGKHCFTGENPDWSFKHELVGHSDNESLVEFIKNNYMLADVIIQGGSYDKLAKTVRFFCKLKPVHEATSCH
jgi:hypothetical protein